MAALERKPDFAQAARDHLGAVHAYVAYLVGNRAVAEDLTATAFEKALRNWTALRP